MRMQRSSFTSLLFLLIFLILQSEKFTRVAEGGKKKVHIPDDLDDVKDNEEDEDWRKWGEKTKSEEFDPPPLNEDTDPVTFQAEMMKRHVGPSFGFVKLRFGVKRTARMVGEIAMKWTKVLMTGGIDARFMAVDLSTIMFNLQRGQDTQELIDFVLEQPDSYEVKVGNQKYRRPGDPPLDEADPEEMPPLEDFDVPVDEERTDNPSSTEEQEQLKDEL